MSTPSRKTVSVAAGIVGSVLVAALLVAGFVSATRGPGDGSRTRTAAAALAGAAQSTSESAGAAQALLPKAKELVIPAQEEVHSLPTSAAPAAPAPKAKTAARAVSRIDAYRGLGSWVDIYDDRAWNDPAAAVRDMAGRGVRTLYIETSNSRSDFAVKDPAAMSTFIREAHARRIKVVAWYLPDMVDLGKDYDRVAQAIRFKTPDGQRFDSFALDIESPAIGSITARNRALDSLSTRIRALVGRSYPLGAIIPSPIGMAKGGSWKPFPYTMLARKYDVFIPMSYYTYHGDGFAAAYADTLANPRIIRAQPGCAKMPVHLIGGTTEESSAGEVEAFVRACNETGVYGASLYSWPGTTAQHWQKLRALKR